MHDSPFRSGRVAIVTGGCRGIGYAIAQRLAVDGMEVIAWDLESSIEEAHRRGLDTDGTGSITPMLVDVSDERAVDAAVGSIVERTGRIDVLVNNAGISPKTNGERTPPDETTTEEWNLVLAVNLTGPFFACRAVIPHMKPRRWGRIVNISSGAGRRGSTVAGLPYGVSKTAINGLTRTLALYLGPDGITVNSVAPGWIRSPMTDIWPPDAQQRWIDTTPVRRPGRPDDIAGLVSYLCRDEAGFITGGTIDINGGSYIAP